MAETNDIYPPKPHITQGSHIGTMEEYQRLYRLSLDDPETFWAKQAERLTWFHPWDTVFDSDYDNVDFAWFLGGRLNACYNCVDRHLQRARRPDGDHLGQGRAGRVRAHHLPRAQARGLPGRQRAAGPRRAARATGSASTCR